jgi:hypothetical protein
MAGIVSWGLILCLTGIAAAQTNVATYHNDSQRTGWNQTKTTLTTANVSPATFGLVASTSLDDQVDTQPLIVTNQTIQGQGVHNVVYVATESNTIYAIDALSGAVLKSHNFGPPVDVEVTVGSYNNGPDLGINGTPTIDVRAQTMYFVAYVLMGTNNPVYQFHAISLSGLQDLPGSPVTVAASHALTDGSAYLFNPFVQRHGPPCSRRMGISTWASAPSATGLARPRVAGFWAGTRRLSPPSQRQNSRIR